MADQTARNTAAIAVNAGYIDRILAGTPYASRVAPYTAKIREQASAAAAPSDPTPALPVPNPATGVPGSPYTAGQVKGPSGVPLTNPASLNAEHDREMAIFIAAQDGVLIAAGKPAGHDGAERGSLPLETNIALAQSLNLPLLVAEFESMRVAGASQ